MPVTILLAATIALTLQLPSSGVLAHRNATGIVKQRMDAMESMGGAMKALRAMLRGKQTYDAERVKAHARIIAGHGDDKLTTLFPKGSLDFPTRAIPAIWVDWDRFSAMARQLTDYAGALAASASNERGAGGAAPAATGEPTPEELAAMPPDAVFARLQENCSGCHRLFRKRKSDSGQRFHRWAGRRNVRSRAADRGSPGRPLAAVTRASSAAAR